MVILKTVSLTKALKIIVLSVFLVRRIHYFARYIISVFFCFDPSLYVQSHITVMFDLLYKATHSFKCGFDILNAWI